MLRRGGFFSPGSDGGAVSRRGSGVSFDLRDQCLGSWSRAHRLLSAAVHARVHLTRTARKPCVFAAAIALPRFGSFADGSWAFFIDALVNAIGVWFGAPCGRSWVAGLAYALCACSAWLEPLRSWLTAPAAMVRCWAGAAPFAVVLPGSVGRYVAETSAPHQVGGWSHGAGGGRSVDDGGERVRPGRPHALRSAADSLIVMHARVGCTARRR